ncbi:sodium:solute symporter family transporter [Neolewinella antarctica]|uniref:SSS family solute:Na+ symporter n=1 Tax=Neolewinella antarctica TaxID=442734 RepID=A0ABX0XFP7_9BACT|nr:sodium/solute symporter [Neolewinella antarctica]NJC28027.1 SSS family solute:Na+ symporter [Neolewinella antarctica]
MQTLEGIDLIIFGVYIVSVILFGVWIANREKSTTASDYFLASRSLPWWAVGGSLIASNISAEQIIGMNGSGFELGLAIATYELMAAITLILVAKFLLPVFLKKEIYTMPQFLEERYDGTVRTIMSVFWIILFVFVNISTVLYLGALAIEQLLGVSLYIGIAGLVIYSACFSIFGGLKAVVWTDVVQVIVLMLGGTLAAVGILSYVGDGSVFTGIGLLMDTVPDHFEMLFEPDDTYIDIAAANELATGFDPDGKATELVAGDEIKSSFQLLPGFAMLFGGMWIVNTYYWGNNQYIIQRALAAKSLGEAQKGIAFAAFMKLFIPFFAVLPGIAAFYLLNVKGETVDIIKADQAFPWVLGNHVGVGFKGLTFAALVAAIGSSISSMVNSASTIFTIDIYNKFINPTASEKRQVTIGQISAGASLIIGAFIAPIWLNAGQAFQIIQEYTGFISPGVLTVFIFGMFYRRGTSKAALAVVLLSVPMSMAFKFLMPELPFLDRMALLFLISSALMIVISSMTSKTAAGTDRASTLDDVPILTSNTGVASQSLVSDMTLRIALALAVIAIGVATAIRLLVQPVPGVPDWAVYLFAILSVVVLVLLFTDKQKADYKAIDLEKSMFRTRTGFNVAAVAVLLVLAAIYGFLATLLDILKMTGKTVN